jgi:hypothetical protein
MKKLVLTLSIIGGFLVSNVAFSNKLDSTEFKDKSEKIARIKYSIDSLIKAELGNIELTDSFDSKCHDYAIKKIQNNTDADSYNGVQFRTVNSVPNDQVSIYDLPLSHLISRVKENLTDETMDIKSWEFAKYSIVFGDFGGKSYMAISMDY